MKQNLIRKVASVATIAAAGAVLASCGGAKKENNVINIQFVPSRDGGDLATLAGKLVPVLQKYEPNYVFKIGTGVSYAATTEALLSDQVDVGFLTASGYAEATLKHPGKVEVALTAVRKGYQVQCDFESAEDQMKAMNGDMKLADGSTYEYLGQQSTEDVDYYTSMLVVRADKYVDKNKDGVIDIHDMAGLKIGRQGTNSGAGYLRPLKYLNDNGMEMKDELDPSKDNQIQGVYVKGYDVALSQMLSNNLDGFWEFTDVRYANAYNKEGNQYYHNSEIFTNSKVVAITDKIYNDTISFRSNLSEDKKAAVKNAFLKAVKDGIDLDVNSEEYKSSGAYLLYNVYSHTGYTIANDSDFEGEREFFNYIVENNLM
jgi:phosphonate transport system substrate-binding protein